MKRSYKECSTDDFLRDIYNSDINHTVTYHQTIEEASEVFEKEFKAILDKHAPVKIFQMRKNYAPFVSEDTKKIMEARDSWKKIAVKFGYKGAQKTARKLGKEIKKALKSDKKEYFQKDFGDKQDTWSLENCKSDPWNEQKLDANFNQNQE